MTSHSIQGQWTIKYGYSNPTGQNEAADREFESLKDVFVHCYSMDPRLDEFAQKWQQEFRTKLPNFGSGKPGAINWFRYFQENRPERAKMLRFVTQTQNLAFLPLKFYGYPEKLTELADKTEGKQPVTPPPVVIPAKPAPVQTYQVASLLNALAANPPPARKLMKLSPPRKPLPEAPQEQIPPTIQVASAAKPVQPSAAAARVITFVVTNPTPMEISSPQSKPRPEQSQVQIPSAALVGSTPKMQISTPPAAPPLKQPLEQVPTPVQKQMPANVDEDFKALKPFFMKHYQVAGRIDLIFIPKWKSYIHIDVPPLGIGEEGADRMFSWFLRNPTARVKMLRFVTYPDLNPGVQADYLLNLAAQTEASLGIEIPPAVREQEKRFLRLHDSWHRLYQDGRNIARLKECWDTYIADMNPLPNFDYYSADIAHAYFITENTTLGPLFALMARFPNLRPEGLSEDEAKLYADPAVLSKLQSQTLSKPTAQVPPPRAIVTPPPVQKKSGMTPCERFTTLHESWNRLYEDGVSLTRLAELWDTYIYKKFADRQLPHFGNSHTAADEAHKFFIIHQSYLPSLFALLARFPKLLPGSLSSREASYYADPAVLASIPIQ